jgi:uncharacterized integral membrane protein (TIGR00697 family)
VDPQRPPRYLDLITASFVAVLLISNVSALKLIKLGGLVFDGAALIFPISYIFGDILTEVYGYKSCRRVIWTGFLWLVIYNLVILGCMYLPPEPGWEEKVGDKAFQAVFANSPRLVVAGVVGFFWGEFANSYVMAKMKIFTAGRHLWTRTVGSTLVGELIDTGLFCVVAFGGTLPWSELLNYTVTGYLYKCAVEIVMTPVTYQIVAFLKREENRDAYDKDTNFSPFHID